MQPWTGGSFDVDKFTTKTKKLRERIVFDIVGQILNHDTKYSRHNNKYQAKVTAK